MIFSGFEASKESIEKQKKKFSNSRMCKSVCMGCDLASEQVEQSTSCLWVTSPEMTSLKKSFNKLTHTLGGGWGGGFPWKHRGCASPSRCFLLIRSEEGEAELLLLLHPNNGQLVILVKTSAPHWWG